MKICLINPPRLLTLTSVSLRATPPLGLAYIAGALKNAGHVVKVIDAIALAPHKATEFEPGIILHGLHDTEVLSIIDEDTDVIGIGCMFSNNWLANRRLIEVIGRKFPTVKIIIGGEHATAVPEICLKQCNSLSVVVLGEGEETMPAVIAQFEAGNTLSCINGIVYRGENNEFVKTPPKSRVVDLEKIPRPAWDLFPIHEYMINKFSYGVDRGRSLPVMATRGCPFSCTFCSSPQMWGTRYYMRSPMDMANEIEELYHTYQIRNFDFYDLTAIIKKEWIIDFCKELVKRNLDITWQIPAGTRSEAIDEEVADWLYKSGCRNITYAPESGSPQTLKLIKKKVKLENMLRSIAASNVKGLNIKLNMMIGFPDERHFNVWETTWFLVKASWAGAHDALPSIFSPYPGSELFERLCAEKKLDPNDDGYWRSIIYGDDYTKGIYYANHLNRFSLWAHIIIQVIAFYGSNFLFRPVRALRTVRNIVTKNYQSRAEITLAELIKRNTQWVIRKESEMGI